METFVALNWLIPLVWTLFFNVYCWVNMDAVGSDKEHAAALSNVIKAQWGVMGSLVAWLIWALFV